MSKTNFTAIRSAVLLLVILCGVTTAYDNALASGEQIKWQVVASGGVAGSSTNLVLSGTVGQTVHGHGTGGSFKINQGFWQNFVGSCTQCGDADGSGFVNITDVVFLINYVFNGTPVPGDCGMPNGLGDADGNGLVNISDAVLLMGFVFNGSPCPHCQGMACW